MRLRCGSINQFVKECDVLLGDVLRSLILHHAGHVRGRHPCLDLSGQAMIVRGKQCETAPGGKPGDHRACDSSAVVRGGASAQLVNENEGVSRCVCKDGGGLLQLDKEGGLPANDIVPGAQPGEHPVDWSQLHCPCRHQTANLSEMVG